MSDHDTELTVLDDDGNLTLAAALANLRAWTAASLRVAQYNAATISTSAGSRSLTNQSASEIRAMIDFWKQRVNELRAAADESESGFSLAHFNNRY